MDFTLECYYCHEHKDPFEVSFTDMVLDGEYRPVAVGKVLMKHIIN